MLIKSHEQIYSLLNQHIAKCVNKSQKYIGFELEFFCLSKNSELNISELDDLIIQFLNKYKYNYSQEKILYIRVKDIGELSIEPGGQLEFSSYKDTNINILLKRSILFVQLLTKELQECGYTIIYAGCNPLRKTKELYKKEKRYLIMREEFDHVGNYGRQMMLNTASLQVSVDFGDYDNFGKNWRNLNLLYPVFVSIFGNSNLFNNIDTGFNSYRQHIIENMNSQRVYGLYRYNLKEDTQTNLRYYSLFLSNCNIFSDKKIFFEEEYLDELLHDVFPVVRIRNYFEVRYFDSQELYDICCPIILTYIVNYDDDMKKWIEDRLDELLSLYNDHLLNAIKIGLADIELRKFCNEFINMAMKVITKNYAGIIDFEYISRIEEYWQKRMQKYDGYKRIQGL